jgi:hypothetical protein
MTKVYFIIAAGRFMNENPMTGIGYLCDKWEQPSPRGDYTITDMEKWFKYEPRKDPWYNDKGEPWAGRFVADFICPIEIFDTNYASISKITLEPSDSPTDDYYFNDNELEFEEVYNSPLHKALNER